MMRFDVETHAWLYKDDLDWFWKGLFPPHDKVKQQGGGIAENAALPNTSKPVWLTIYSPIWINSPYLKERDRRIVLSYVGRSVITTR